MVFRDLYKSQLAVIHSARRAQDLSMTQTGTGMLTTGHTGELGHCPSILTAVDMQSQAWFVGKDCTQMHAKLLFGHV